MRTLLRWHLPTQCAAQSGLCLSLMIAVSACGSGTLVNEHVPDKVAEDSQQSPESINTDISPTLVPVIAVETSQPAAFEIDNASPQTPDAIAQETPSSGITIANSSPVITGSSYNCDPVIDAIGYNVGDVDSFTLSVNDESPFTLRYAVDSSNSGIVDIAVDENGIFTVTALSAGESYLWLSAEDDHGLVDEQEIWVVVN